jgi:hypothetical protein
MAQAQTIRTPQDGKGTMTDYAFLHDLDLASLLDLRAAIEALIAERMTEANLGSTDPHQDGDLPPKSDGGDPPSRPHGGWVELKTISGCGPYAYLRWRENGRCRSKYLGKVEEARVNA